MIVALRLLCKHLQRKSVMQESRLDGPIYDHKNMLNSA